MSCSRREPGAVDPRPELVERRQLAFDRKLEATASADLGLRRFEPPSPSLRARLFSSVAVCVLDSFASTRVSSPSAIATTPTMTERAERPADPLARIERALHPRE